MNTMVISLEEAAKDLAAVIHRLEDCGGRVVLMGPGGPLAEISSVAQGGSRHLETPLAAANEADGEHRERTRPRVVYSKLTGLPVVTARPGQRKITSEEIYEELRNSFP